jgi:hypothetical protein
MKPVKPIYTLIALVVIGAAAFFGGMQYQKSKTPQMMTFNRNGNGGTQFMQGGRTQGGNFIRRNGQGMQPVAGEIIAADDKSITVKMQDGSTKIVLIADTTAINKAEQGTKTDLKTGEKVLVFGSTNNDGSVTAQNVQLNPPQRMMMNNNAPSGGRQ